MKSIVTLLVGVLFLSSVHAAPNLPTSAIEEVDPQQFNKICIFEWSGGLRRLFGKRMNLQLDYNGKVYTCKFQSEILDRLQPMQVYSCMDSKTQELKGIVQYLMNSKKVIFIEFQNDQTMPCFDHSGYEIAPSDS